VAGHDGHDGGDDEELFATLWRVARFVHREFVIVHHFVGVVLFLMK